MTYVRAHYAERPSQELVRLDSFEILHSPLAEPVDYARATALAFFAEVLEQTLPDHDPHDVVFRLLLSVLEQTRVDHIWMPITYFALWITRLLGWLPDLGRCMFCNVSLLSQPAFFHLFSDGFVCVQHRQTEERSAALTPDSQNLAVRIFRSPASAFAAEPWEMIQIHDAASLAEGYARGVARSRGEILLFSHDDVEILNPQHFVKRLRGHLANYDLIGVAGTRGEKRERFERAGKCECLWKGYDFGHGSLSPSER